MKRYSTDTDRDFFMSGAEAKEYGIVDEVIDSIKKKEETAVPVAKKDEEALKCSFCGKGQDEVKKLIAGPTVYICNECVELCNEIIADALQ